MTKHVIEVTENVVREGREISLDTAARHGAAKLFSQVAQYLGEGVQYPREATIAYSWRQGDVTSEHEIWHARAEISLHPPSMQVENPHSVPMDNRISEDAG